MGKKISADADTATQPRKPKAGDNVKYVGYAPKTKDRLDYDAKVSKVRATGNLDLNVTFPGTKETFIASDVHYSTKGDHDSWYWPA